MQNQVEVVNFDIEKYSKKRGNPIDFKFPVQRYRMSKAIMTEPPNFSTKIRHSLDKVAGQIAYNELKYQIKGAVFDTGQSKDNSKEVSQEEIQSMRRSGTLKKKNKQKSFKLDKSQNLQAPQSKNDSSKDEGQNGISAMQSTSMPKNLEFKAPQLIKYALDQIEQDTISNMIKNGKNRQLSNLEKGRLIIQFMNNKNEPFKNRQFYDHFFREHDKAEQIQIIEDVSNKIKAMFAQDHLEASKSGKQIDGFQHQVSEDILKYLQQDFSINDLKLSQGQKAKLLKIIQQDEMRREELNGDRAEKKINVKTNSTDLLGAMTNHKHNALYSSNNLKKNIVELNQSLQLEKVMPPEVRYKHSNKQKIISHRLSNSMNLSKEFNLKPLNLQLNENQVTEESVYNKMPTSQRVAGSHLSLMNMNAFAANQHGNSSSQYSFYQKLNHGEMPNLQRGKILGQVDNFIGSGERQILSGMTQQDNFNSNSVQMYRIPSNNRYENNILSRQMKKRTNDNFNPNQEGLGEMSNFEENDRGSQIIMSHEGFQNNSQLNLNSVLPKINYQDKDQVLRELKGYKFRDSQMSNSNALNTSRLLQDSKFQAPLLNREAQRNIFSQHRDRHTFNSKKSQNIINYQNSKRNRRGPIFQSTQSYRVNNQAFDTVNDSLMAPSKQAKKAQTQNQSKINSKRNVIKVEGAQDDGSVNLSSESNQETNIRGSIPSQEKVYKQVDPSYDSICDDTVDNKNINHGGSFSSLEDAQNQPSQRRQQPRSKNLQLISDNVMQQGNGTDINAFYHEIYDGPQQFNSQITYEQDQYESIFLNQKSIMSPQHSYQHQQSSLEDSYLMEKRGEFTQRIADYKNINSKDLNKLSKEGKILALLPNMKDSKNPVLKGITKDFQDMIINSTLMVNETKDKSLYDTLENQREEINEMNAQIGASPTQKMSAYDRYKKEKFAAVKKANSDFLIKKHQSFMKQQGRGITKAQREENEREMRRKITQEKAQLHQFGEIEGCLKQIDRMKELDKLFKSGGRLTQNTAKKIKEMQKQKNLKLAQRLDYSQ